MALFLFDEIFHINSSLTSCGLKCCCSESTVQVTCTPLSDVQHALHELQLEHNGRRMEYQGETWEFALTRLGHLRRSFESAKGLELGTTNGRGGTKRRNRTIESSFHRSKSLSTSGTATDLVLQFTFVQVVPQNSSQIPD